MKRVGIALGGGGAKGFAHLAFLDVLDRNGIKPCAVSGTSIGAIIGALYCAGKSSEEILEFVSRLDETTSKGKKRRLLIQLEAVRPSRRAKWMKRFIENLLPVETFEELKIPLKICAVDFYSLEEKMFDSGKLVDAVMASIALPGGVPPYPIGDKYYIDGGATNVVPLDYIRDDCNVLIGIDVSSIIPTPPNRKPSATNAKIAFKMATRKALLDEKRRQTGADLFYKVIFDNIGTLDFLKYREAYETGLTMAREFEEDIKRLL